MNYKQAYTILRLHEVPAEDARELLSNADITPQEWWQGPGKTIIVSWSSFEGFSIKEES